MIPRYIADFDLQTLPRMKTEVAVIGAGIAGLYTALQASEQNEVVLISKKKLDDSNTRWAQGGIAAVTAKSDSPALHRQDTLIAGAGLCSYEAVEVLVHEGPERLKELIAYGTEFDKDAEGRYELTKEGAHSKRRILHAHGDATGAEIVRALSARVREKSNITVLEDHFAIDVVTQDGECVGVIAMKPDGERFFLEAKATVLATGERVSSTATRPTRRSRQRTESRSRIGPERGSRMWSLSSFTRQRCIIRVRRAFSSRKQYAGKGRFSAIRAGSASWKSTIRKGIGAARRRSPGDRFRDGAHAFGLCLSGYHA